MKFELSKLLNILLLNLILISQNIQAIGMLNN